MVFVGSNSPFAWPQLDTLVPIRGYPLLTGKVGTYLFLYLDIRFVLNEIVGPTSRNAVTDIYL